MSKMQPLQNRIQGFTLLEVVLAIAVFAFGLLALVQLQSGLARSGADATTRTVAVNIAEEYIEAARGFTQIAAIPDNLRTEYDEILSDGPDPVPVRVGADPDVPDSGFGVEYQRHVIVQDYYWDATTETFTTEAPAGIVNSDYKTIDIVVMWRDLDAGESETWGDHGTIKFAELGGGVRIIESVTSSPPTSGALVATERVQAGGPQVIYNPGENPDIIQLTLDEAGGKFKEATTPAPDVFRDDKVETWFDVVTYSQLPGSDAFFLRREEFAAITCSCELENLPTPENYGLKPTLWNGVDYTEGEKVAKPIGIPAGPDSAQSMFCGVCCRDHHDGAGSGAEDVYTLENVGSDVDHPHFTRDKKGDIVIVPVTDGDEYLEACRLIRKDGFMRVTHDANQGTLIGFPEGYLEFDEGAAAYSAYVVESAGDYYSLGLEAFPQPNPPDPSPHTFPARTPETATSLPKFIGFGVTQQARARGVYTDYLTSAAQDVIDQCFPIAEDGSRPGDCPAPNTSTPMEIYPFFDVQLTLLARWIQGPIVTGLVSVSNEPVETGNTHSRGFLELISTNTGQSRIEIESQRGNLGLTSTGPIDPLYDFRKSIDGLYVNANGDDVPAPPIGVRVYGSLTSGVRRVSASDLLLESTEALCGNSDTDWECVVTGPAQLKVSNYYLNMPRTYACSELGFASESVGPPAENHYTIFDLPLGGEADIWITDDFSICPR